MNVPNNARPLSELPQEQQNRALLVLWANGHTVAHLHKVTGLSEAWLYRRLRSLGIDVDHPSGRVPSAREQRIIDEYTAGASIADLVEEYAASYRQIRGLLLTTGVKLRPGHRRPTTEPATQEMIDDYKTMGYRQMGKKYKIDRVTLIRRLQLAGVQPRPVGRPRKKPDPPPPRT